MPDPDKDKKMFDEDYVKGLRDEAASWRNKLRDKEKEFNDKINLTEDELKEYKRLKADSEAAKRKKIKDEGNFDALLNEMKENQQKEIKKLQDLIQEKDSKIDELNKSIDTRNINKLISDAALKFNAISPTDIQLRLEKELSIEKTDDGKTVISILDKDNNKILNSKGQPISIEDRVEQMKEAESTAHLFKGGSSGSGTHLDVDQNKGPSAGEMTAIQRAAQERAKIFKDK